MASQEKALRYLSQDRLFYMDMLEPIRRGSARLLYAEEDGVLLHERESGAHMLTVRDEAALEKVLPLLSGCEVLVGHELWCKDALVRCSGLREEELLLYQAGWMEPEPPAALPFNGELRLLTEDWAPWAYEHYSHPFGGVEYMVGAVRRGMLGAFVAGEPAGFVSFHDEGTIGMLEVLPQYRRRGLGEVLLRAAVRLALERGQYAFGQVRVENAPSLALQRKVGMTVSKDILYWLF